MWKAEVIADSTGKWCGNQLRFKTREEAEAYVRDLAWRWTSVIDTRVREETRHEELRAELREMRRALRISKPRQQPSCYPKRRARHDPARVV